jgi:hypothetical protein
MSSRNCYLDADEREQAGALSAALLAGKYAAAGGAAAATAGARASAAAPTMSSRRLRYTSRPVISPLLIAPPRLISIAIRPPYVAECTSHPGPLVTTVSILPPKGEGPRRALPHP